MSYKLPSQVFSTYKSVVDAMISDNFGVNCQIQYPSEKTVCTNCVFNSFTGKSSNIYKAGGPIQFTNGICPYCNGDGYTDSTVTEIIKLRCYYEVKHWIKLPVNFNYPAGTVQTIGFIKDLEKCKRANYIILNSDKNDRFNSSYRLLSEPVPHGFGRDKYFIAMWERTN